MCAVNCAIYHPLINLLCDPSVFSHLPMCGWPVSGVDLRVDFFSIPLFFLFLDDYQTLLMWFIRNLIQWKGEPSLPHLPMPCWLCCFICPYALLLQLLNFSKRLHLKFNLNCIEVVGWFGEFTTTYQIATQHRPFQNVYHSGIIHLAIITECSPHARHGSGHQLNSSEKQNGPKLCLCQAYTNKWPSEGLTKYVIHW